MYLLDTDVLSATSPVLSHASGNLAGWLERNDEHLFLSAITVAEIEDGIIRTRHAGARRKSARLSEWLESVLILYGRRVLPFDLAAARAAGKLSGAARSRGHSPGFADAAIAGIARVNDLTVLTRNLKHFRSLDVAALDPAEGLP